MTLTNLCLQVVLGFAITVGFGVLFNTPYSVLPYCAIVGAIGHVLRYSLQRLGASNELATFAGAFAVGVVGYWMAHRSGQPRLVFTVTAVISMVPGIPAYETIMLFTRNNTLDGVQSAIRVFLSAGAITTGLSSARLLMDMLKEARHAKARLDEANTGDAKTSSVPLAAIQKQST